MWGLTAHCPALTSLCPSALQGSFLCDWVLLCCMDKERRYSSRKFEQVPLG